MLMGFQSALHPKVKGIVVDPKKTLVSTEFQSALHPKVKGINDIRRTITVTPRVSIRPSPKGEGNS